MKRKEWSQRFENCQQCGTNRFRHVARGLCSRCYGLVRRLGQIDQWNPSDPKSLKGYPLNDLEKFDLIKAGYSAQIKERLESLRMKEELLRSPIDGLVIEHQLRRLAQWCGAKEHLFHQVDMVINQNFSKKQRKILHELLNRIEENVPWGGPDLLTALRPDLFW